MQSQEPDTPAVLESVKEIQVSIVMSASYSGQMMSPDRQPSFGIGKADFNAV